MEPRAVSNPTANPIAHLTRALAAGDENAFREFHAEYFNRLYRFLLVVTQGQEQDAQEALQQTLLRVVRYARVFESEEVFWSWLKTLARSAARDGNRKRRRYSALLEGFAVRLQLSSPNTTGNEEDRLYGVLEESLAELAPDERRWLEAKYVEGGTVKELCQQTGLTLKTVESRLARSRARLRERVLRKLASS